MESVHGIFTRAGAPSGEISVCPVAAPSSDLHFFEVRKGNLGEGRPVVLEISSVQLGRLLFTAGSSVYVRFAVWSCQIYCCGCFNALFPLPRRTRRTARPNVIQRGIVRFFSLLTLFGWVRKCLGGRVSKHIRGLGVGVVAQRRQVSAATGIAKQRYSNRKQPSKLNS